MKRVCGNHDKTTFSAGIGPPVHVLCQRILVSLSIKSRIFIYLLYLRAALRRNGLLFAFHKNTQTKRTLHVILVFPSETRRRAGVLITSEYGFMTSQQIYPCVHTLVLFSPVCPCTLLCLYLNRVSPPHTYIESTGDRLCATRLAFDPEEKL